MSGDNSFQDPAGRDLESGLLEETHTEKGCCDCYHDPCIQVCGGFFVFLLFIGMILALIFGLKASEPN